MLTTLVILTSIIGVILIVLLMFILGKLNWLENATNSLLAKIDINPVLEPGIDSSPDITDPYFYGLTGKKLWSSLTGEDYNGVNEIELEEIRPRYTIVLIKALAKFIKENLNDPNNNDLDIIKNIRTVSTSRGKIDIWLPSNTVDKLHDIGSLIRDYHLNKSENDKSDGESVVASKEEQRASIETTIRAIVHDVVQQTGVKYHDDISEDLIKLVL